MENSALRTCYVTLFAIFSFRFFYNSLGSIYFLHAAVGFFIFLPVPINCKTILKSNLEIGKRFFSTYPNDGTLLRVINFRVTAILPVFSLSLQKVHVGQQIFHDVNILKSNFS